MNGFERRKEQKKENIRRAALELFQVYGFKKASISEIAARAGVSPVTIYNHFSSKEELVGDVLKALLRTMLDKYSAILKGDKPFLEKLEVIVFDKARLAQQFQGELFRAVAAEDPELRRFIESLWHDEITRMLIDFFNEGRKEGVISPELSRESVLLYYDVIRQGVFHSSSLSESIERKPELVKEIMSLFTYGLNG